MEQVEKVARVPRVRRFLLTEGVLVVLLFAGTVLGFHLLQNFPLDDDFAYGLAVRHLLETGDYRPPQWIAAPTITHILWGALFCLPFGFSFTALHVASFVASVICVVGIYMLVSETIRCRWVVLVATLTLAFNPVYYELSCIFNTDVPFMAMLVSATLLFSKSIARYSHALFWGGTLLVVAATLARELAICVPIALFFATLVFPGDRRLTPARAMLPLLLSILAFFLLRYWLSETGRLPTIVDSKTMELLQAFTTAGRAFIVVLGNIYTILMYLGLFLLPVLVISAHHVLIRRASVRNHDVNALVLPASVAFWVALLIAGGATLYVGRQRGFLAGGPGNFAPFMPINDFYITRTGLGPAMANQPPESLMLLGTGFWVVVTGLCCGGAVLLGLLGTRLVRRLARCDLRTSTEWKGAVFLLLCAVIYILPLLTAALMDERYLIPAVPFFVAGILRAFNVIDESDQSSYRIRRVTAVALMAVFSLYALIGTRDYLEWQGVRWTALQDLLTKDRARAIDIGGGGEQTAFYSYYDPYDPADPMRSPWLNQAIREDKMYFITLSPKRGYCGLREYSYRRWLPPHIETMLVLRRQGEKGVCADSVDRHESQ